MTRPSRFTDCTWDEIKQLSDEGCLVVLPVGQVVAHGPHLPVCADVRQAEGVCEAVAQALESRGVRAFVGPVVPFGNSPAQEAFAGFVNVSPETLTGLITDVCESLARQGFPKQLMVMFSPGAWPSVQTVAATLARKGEVQLYVFDGLELARALSQDLLEGHRPQEGKLDAHAGELETSLMLALEPSRVKMERAVTHYSGLMAELQGTPLGGMSLRQKMLSINLWDWARFGPEGVTGAATLATEAKGRTLLERLGAAVAEHFIKHAVQK